MKEKVREKLGEKIEKWQERNSKRIYIQIKKEDIKKAVDIVFNDMGARYQIVTGVDNFDSFELLYHFSFDKEGGVIVSLRTFLERENPEIESLVSLIPGIAWIEREIWELLGINFVGHPNLKHLLLPEDWPEGNYPLRKY
ncbi:MAG: NADH-quinone oxidoreductase subunit C, partial [Elusimicrobia bacterium]|nr:NADH-quinone oxidoreductase subunit C [Elusimicrobiota bacterium]